MSSFVEYSIVANVSTVLYILLSKLYASFSSIVFQSHVLNSWGNETPDGTWHFPSLNLRPVMVISVSPNTGPIPGEIAVQAYGGPMMLDTFSFHTSPSQRFAHPPYTNKLHVLVSYTHAVPSLGFKNARQSHSTKWKNCDCQHFFYRTCLKKSLHGIHHFFRYDNITDRN